MRHGKLRRATRLAPEHSVSSQAVKMLERLVTPVPHLCCCAALNCKSSTAGKEHSAISMITRVDRAREYCIPWRARS